MSEPESARLLSIDEVGALLGCHRRTVHRLHISGKLPSPVKLSRLVRWPEHAIKQWIKQGCPEQPASRKRAKPANTSNRRMRDA